MSAPKLTITLTDQDTNALALKLYLMDRVACSPSGDLVRIDLVARTVAEWFQALAPEDFDPERFVGVALNR